MTLLNPQQIHATMIDDFRGAWRWVLVVNLKRVRIAYALRLLKGIIIFLWKHFRIAVDIVPVVPFSCKCKKTFNTRDEISRVENLITRIFPFELFGSVMRSTQWPVGGFRNLARGFHHHLWRYHTLISMSTRLISNFSSKFSFRNCPSKLFKRARKTKTKERGG